MNNDFWDRLRRVSDQVGVDVSTFYVWKNRKAVPPARHYELVEAAKELSIPLDYKELNNQQGTQP